MKKMLVDGPMDFGKYSTPNLQAVINTDKWTVPLIIMWKVAVEVGRGIQILNYNTPHQPLVQSGQLDLVK